MVRKISFAVALLTVLAIPSNASATVTCTLAANVLSVEVTGTGDQAAALRLETGTGEIGVWDSIFFGGPPAPGTQQACTGGPATPANTNSIVVTDTEAGSAQRTLLKVSLAGGPFINSDTTSEGTGTKEIEITYDGGNEAQDDLLFDGAPSPVNDNWRMGELGGNHAFQLDNAETGTVDVDDVVASNVEQLQVAVSDTNPGNDTYDARGGTGFDGPLTFNTSVKQLSGGDGDDQLFAGDGNGWTLQGGLGNDTMIGGPGNDSVALSAGTDPDTADGNGGTDFCHYTNHGAAVQVDLRVTAPQDTVGAGIDTISDCEALGGGAEGDTLIGTDGPNSLSGGETSALQTGGDTLIGLGGNDILSGSFGSDTVSYAQGSTGPVTVDLNIVNPTSQPTGGAGNDTIDTVENITGSEFGDTLTGDGNDNRIDVYDGIFDTANCGGGTDNAIADEIGVDTLTNCETTDNAPQTSIASGPANGTTVADSTPTYGLQADEPSSFQFSVDGGGFTSCGASCDVSALADGIHTLRFRAKDNDEHGNVDLTPVQRTVGIDTVGPAIQIDSRPDDPTNSPNPGWQFSSAESGVSFECQVDGGGFAPCNAGPAHSAGSLADGPHTFAVRGRDALGNAGPTLTDDFTVDRTGPEIQISGRPPEFTNDATPTWEFSSAESGITYECIVDGAAQASPCSGPGASHTAAALDDGMHSLVVFARDALGNQGPTASDQLTVDTHAPETDLLGNPKIKTTRKRVKVPFESGESPVTFECSFDGAAFKKAVCSSPFKTPKMKRGTKHTLEIRAIDQAGNVEATPARVKIKRRR